MRFCTVAVMTAKAPKANTKQATKKKAVAPLTEQAKMILRTVRRQLATEQAALAERQHNEMINRLRNNIQPMNSAPQTYLRRTYTDPAELAFQKIVIPRTTAVLTSEGIRATVNVKMNAHDNTGWTDFQNINVTMMRGIEADPRNASAVLRGILYHEGGHIKWTVPFNVLINRYNEAIRGTSRVRLSSMDMGKYHKAWNVAEDQRMEMQVIDDSPSKALYFVPMVLDVVLSQDEDLAELRQRVINGETITDQEMAEATALHAGSYPYLAWRRYMPQSMRRELRNKYIAVHGLAACRTMERALTSYIRSSDPIEMVDAIVAFHDAITTAGVILTVDNHGGMTGWRVVMPDGREDEATIPTPTMPDNDEVVDMGDDDPDELDATDENADDEDHPPFEGFHLPDDKSWVPPSTLDHSIDDDDAVDDEDDETEPPPMPPTEGQNNEDVERDATNIPEDDDDLADDDDDKDLTDTLEELLNEAIEARNADPVLNDDERSYNLVMANDNPGSKLMPLHSSAETDTGIVATAITLAEQLEEAFHAVTIEACPTWREQQTRGVLNVGRYLTRQPGDREFFRDFDGAEGNKPGYNMAVSVLLDYSGSMNESVTELAATAYAMKVACQNLDIPCTVSLWDNDARLLWDGTDTAEYVPVFASAGSTDPTIALNDLHNQRYDKETHIVLLMTDGEFYAADGYLNAYRTEGTYFIGTYYKHGQSCTSKELNEMSAKGFDIVHGVTELGDLVDLMESALCESVKMPVSA